MTSQTDQPAKPTGFLDRWRARRSPPAAEAPQEQPAVEAPQVEQKGDAPQEEPRVDVFPREKAGLPDIGDQPAQISDKPAAEAGVVENAPLESVSKEKISSKRAPAVHRALSRALWRADEQDVLDNNQRREMWRTRRHDYALKAKILIEAMEMENIKIAVTSD